MVRESKGKRKTKQIDSNRMRMMVSALAEMEGLTGSKQIPLLG